MFANHQDLRLLTTLVGAGDRRAFRSLYALLAPAILGSVRTEVTELGHAEAVVRATFCEVWWMCVSDRYQSAQYQDVPQWIAGMAARRCEERRRALDLISGDPSLTGRSLFWMGLLASHDLLMARELDAMLDGQDSRLTRQRAT